MQISFVRPLKAQYVRFALNQRNWQLSPVNRVNIYHVLSMMCYQSLKTTQDHDYKYQNCLVAFICMSYETLCYSFRVSTGGGVSARLWPRLYTAHLYGKGLDTGSITVRICSQWSVSRIPSLWNPWTALPTGESSVHEDQKEVHCEYISASSI